MKNALKVIFRKIILPSIFFSITSSLLMHFFSVKGNGPIPMKEVPFAIIYIFISCLLAFTLIYIREELHKDK